MTKRLAAVDEERLEVHVNGRIELGRALELESADPFDGEQEFTRRHTLSDDVSWLDRHQAEAPPRDVERRLVEHTLSRGTHTLPMSNQGLVLQYGILGAPGSGKTNLLMHVLNQVMAHERGNPTLKFGGLILDPKAALIKDAQRIFRRLDRKDDLVVVNARELLADKNLKGGVNIIDCALSSTDLGEALVLAARSAGIDASEPFWLQQLAKTLGAIIALIRAVAPDTAPTLQQVMHYAVGTTTGGNGSADENLEHLIARAGKKLNVAEEVLTANPDLRDARIELENLQRYASRVPGKSEPKGRQVVEQLMEQAFSIFRLSENACYSVPTAPGTRSLYDQIIEDGKVLMVCPGPQKLTLSRILPSLMKLIFQRTVLSRFERYRNKDVLTNKDRPVLFMADEYHTVATQLEGVPFGDSEFFSQARQFGALCLVATQSVEQLQRSGLGDAWKAVFATLAAVVFMRGQDPATRQYLEDLAGPREYRVRRRDHSRNDGQEGLSWSIELVDAPAIPKGVLEGFTRGDAVVVGTTEGNEVPTSIRYVNVPKWDLPEEAGKPGEARGAEGRTVEEPKSAARRAFVQEVGR
jgi:TraM recognition site of TraD and TraG